MSQGTPYLPRVATIPIQPSMPAHLGFTQGNIFHVRPKNGLDANTGRSTVQAAKTLAAVVAATLGSAGDGGLVADQNDTVRLYAESNTAANTTDYQLATLDWSKDGTHLVGICAGGPYNKRARIAWATAAASASDIPLFKLSANNCYLANLSLAVGHADANLSFGMQVTGDNHLIENVDIAFPTNAANDVAGAYALKLDGCDQTEFRNGTIGSFTTDLGGAANQLLLVTGGCSMVKFVNYDFIMRISSNTNSPFVRLVDTNAIGFGCLWFENCRFIAVSVNNAHAQTGAFKCTAAQAAGRIVLTNCTTNAGKWDADDLNMILNGCTALPIGDTAGVALAV